jgi:hypothetical protein
MRLFFGGISTETNTFSPIPVGLESFTEGGILRGHEVCDPVRGSDMAIYARELGLDVVGGLYCEAHPGAAVRRDAYEALRDELTGTGVTVSAVLPSAVRTDLVSGVKLGGMLPTVDPEDIARAIVQTCQDRSAIVAVPRWMRSYEAAAALLPDRMLGAVRGRLTRQRVLRTLDATARSAYDERIRRDAAADR